MSLSSAARPTAAAGLAAHAPAITPTGHSHGTVDRPDRPAVTAHRAATARPVATTRSAATTRLSGRSWVVVAAIAGIVAIYATNQVVPATSAHQAEMRIWLAARAAGFLTLGLLTLQVVLGLVLSHPTNKTTWKLSKLLFPWHENAWVFVMAFLALHVVTIVADPYAGVGIGGALVPGLSTYRSVPVALGTLGLHALLITGLTARYTKLLPKGLWLKLHRLSLLVLMLSWAHGVLAGTDSVALAGVYGASFTLVLAAAAYRYWVSRSGRPTFSTSLPGGIPMTLQLLVRRALVVAGVAAALMLGGVSIQLAAAWTAAAAPLNDPPASLASIQADLETERARSAALEEQLRTLETASADLAAALEAAKGQVASDTATAEELRASLAAAKEKLTKLEAALARAAAARTTTTVTTTTAPPPNSHDDDDDEGPSATPEHPGED